MSETDVTIPPFDVRLWSLVTFRTITFTVALALVAHLRGSLAATLARLDTTIGFAVFAMLWATTWFATRIGLRYHGSATSDGGWESTLETTIVAGGWNGVFVWLALVIGVMVMSAGVAPPAAIVSFILAATLGSLLAFTFGGVVGLIYAIVETILIAVGERLVRFVTGSDPTLTPVRSGVRPHSDPGRQSG